MTERLDKTSDLRSSDSKPEIHLFLLWSNALGRANDILEDIRSRFSIREVFSVEWSREHFAQNLTRFYGQILVEDSEKEIHCGVDPFLVVVVADEKPSYALRRTSHGKMDVNARMFDAKKRYRRWTGGGHRVHATLNTRETDKDLFLLLGRRAAFYETGSRDEWDGTIVAQRRDLVGASGWKSRSELLNAFEASIGYVALAETDWGDMDELDGALTLLVGDLWWAARIANGTGERDAELHVLVAEGERRIALREVGDGSLDPVWQRTLMAHAIRDSDGVLIPEPVDRFYLALRDIASDGRELSRPGLELLDELARQHSLPRGDYGDRAFASAAVNEYLAQLHTGSSVEPLRDRSGGRLAPLTGLIGRLGGRRAS